MANNLDKITGRELSVEVNEMLLDSVRHIDDLTIHVTTGDKTNWNNKLHAGSPTATPAANGLFSKEDKIKLNGIAINANKYVHPDSVIVPATYASLSIDAQGHATGGVPIGDLETTINIRVQNANQLGGLDPEDYLKKFEIASPLIFDSIEPTNLTKIWVKADDNNSLWGWNGVMWDRLSSSAIIKGATAPANTGALWLNTTTKRLNFHNGVSWSET